MNTALQNLQNHQFQYESGEYDHQIQYVFGDSVWTMFEPAKNIKAPDFSEALILLGRDGEIIFNDL